MLRISTTSEAETLIARLESTYAYPAREVPRHAMVRPIKFMMDFYIIKYDDTKILELANRALVYLSSEVVGFDASPTDFRIVRWGRPEQDSLD